MLQFNHSVPVNSNAAYPNVTASLGTTNLFLDFTQSYDFSTKRNVFANMINTVSPLNEWLVFQITGSSSPTASGQYNVDIYEAYFQPLLTWGTQNTIWANTSIIWSSAGGYLKGSYLTSERAWVSGSNGYDITQYLLPVVTEPVVYGLPSSSAVIQYLSPVNGGTYTTYNYPQ
jgi:hypothetical protein